MEALSDLPYFPFSQLKSIIDPHKRKSLNTILGSLVGKNLVEYKDNPGCHTYCLLCSSEEK